MGYLFIYYVLKTSTYQSHKKKKYLKAPAQGSPTDNVPVPHSGHGHHQEVDTVPVGQALTIREVRRISRIFKLKCLFLLLEKIADYF